MFLRHSLISSASAGHLDSEEAPDLTSSVGPRLSAKREKVQQHPRHLVQKRYEEMLETPGTISGVDCYVSSASSVKGRGDGGFLIKKIAELQRRLEFVEAENKDLRARLEEAETAVLEAAEDLDEKVPSESTEGEMSQCDQSMDASFLTSQHSKDNNINYLELAGKETREIEVGGRRILEQHQCNLTMSDEKMVDAMNQITTGVHRLEGAMRQHLSATSSLRRQSGSNPDFEFGSSLGSTDLHHISLRDAVCGHGTPRWWSRLKVGDAVDARDKDRQWYAAKILKVQECESSKDCPRATLSRRNHAPARSELWKSDVLSTRVLIRFDGWSPEWDIWLHSIDDVAELAPRGLHVPAPKTNREPRTEDNGFEIQRKTNASESPGSTSCSEQPEQNFGASSGSSSPTTLPSPCTMSASPGTDSLLSSGRKDTPLNRRYGSFSRRREHSSDHSPCLSLSPVEYAASELGDGSPPGKSLKPYHERLDAVVGVGGTPP